MIGCKVVEELLDIPSKGVDGARSNKAVSLLTAATIPELPGIATDGCGINDRADGLDGTIMGKPVIFLLAMKLSVDKLVLG